MTSKKDEAEAAQPEMETRSVTLDITAPVGAGRVGVIATTTLKNAMAVYYGTQCTHASLHTADPGTTGTSEVTGGTYARQAVTWSAASNGTITGSVTWPVPAGSTPSYIGFFNALSAGTFQDKISITAQNFATSGTLQASLSYTQS